MLQDMLRNSQKFGNLPTSTREIYMALAEVFEDNDYALWLSPEELVTKLGRGNKRQWADFLQLEPVEAYINAQVASYLQVSNRKSIKTLGQEGAAGDTQAARRVNELSGIMNQDSNKVVVLHQVKRPKEKVQNDTDNR